jgi:serine/threonine protein kinase
MLTGVTPFNDPSPASLALQHITDEPPRPRSINPNLSPNVEEVLLKALDKDPKNRYQTGKNLIDALRLALAEKAAIVPVDAPPMPPIPVNAPTIQRNSISLNSFTKRGDVITALEKHSTTMRRGAVEELLVAEQRSKRKRAVWGVLILLLLFAGLFLGWYRPDLLASATSLFSAATPLPVPTQTEQLSIPSVFTDTPISEPAFTETFIPTATLTSTATVTISPSPTFTQTNTPTETPTATFNAIPATASPTSTAQIYPDGYLMTAFYNENSFYLLDTGNASRSLSGFVFERVNSDETFHNRFEGWTWETYSLKAIQPNRCVSLEIDKSPLPYLNPVECKDRVRSNLSPVMNADEIFWTPNENSSEFRVLWLNQEVGRCQIVAGTCDFRVP